MYNVSEKPKLKMYIFKAAQYLHSKSVMDKMTPVPPPRKMGGGGGGGGFKNIKQVEHNRDLLREV
jgi:hypothetical protein